MRLLAIVFSMGVVACLPSCNSTSGKTTNPVRASFFDKSGMDTSVSPGNNFFLYANGQWVKTSKIADDQSGAGSFYTLYEDNLLHLKSILEASAKDNATKGSLEQKTGDYFSSGMDTVAIDQLGASPLKPILAKIDGIKTFQQLMPVMADLEKSSDQNVLGLYVGADDKNSQRNIVILGQSGLSLPEREYYFKKDSASNAARNALLKYAANLFALTGVDTATAAKNSQSILALETLMANAHRTAVELRDPQANYNKLSVAQLEQMSPNIGWTNVFRALSIKTDSLNVAQPAYYKALSTLLQSQPLGVWKTKLQFDYISTNASLLSKSFVDARFNFNRTFSGQKQQSARWKTMVNAVDDNLGELLGQLYVKKYFTPEAKLRMDELINNLQKAFEKRINHLDWMSDSTKGKAQQKLTAFLKKIGYPGKWKNYDDVTVDPAHYYQNAKSAQLHNFKEMLAKVNQPVDRTEWGMTPPTVNAYYNPGNNEIVFPAGILQFPFFDANADDAINYGGIGMVIGHEMTHGFDDQGCQYDAVGNLKNWWGTADANQFKAKTGNVVQQYNAYTLLGGLHVNGALTLGENLADIGGLAIAYDAFKMTKQGQGKELIDGFTPDQRFFLGYAQVWRVKNRDESMRSRLNSDPHSPEMFRVNGPAVNFDPFYAAFNIQSTDKMYKKPADRIKIW